MWHLEITVGRSLQFYRLVEPFVGSSNGVRLSTISVFRWWIIVGSDFSCSPAAGVNKKITRDMRHGQNSLYLVILWRMENGHPTLYYYPKGQV